MTFSRYYQKIHYQHDASTAKENHPACNPMGANRSFSVTTENWKDVNCKKCLKLKESQNAQAKG